VRPDRDDHVVARCRGVVAHGPLDLDRRLGRLADPGVDGVSHADGPGQHEPGLPGDDADPDEREGDPGDPSHRPVSDRRRGVRSV